MKKIGLILLICSIFSIPFAYGLCTIIGEAHIFGVGGAIRYSFLIWLALPVSFAYLFYSGKLKNNGLSYKPHRIVAIICIFLTVLFGSYRWIFAEISTYDEVNVRFSCKDVNIDLPNDIKVANSIYDDQVVSYVKINNLEEKAKFEEAILQSALWTELIDMEIQYTISYFYVLETLSFDYYLFYNKTTNEYNAPVVSNEAQRCIFIAYDSDEDRIIIINGKVENRVFAN